MKQLVRSITGSTIRLAIAISVLSVVLGVVLVRLAGVPQTIVVVGVMAVAFLLSMVQTARPDVPAAHRAAHHEKQRAA